jgi:hypothetical protein
MVMQLQVSVRDHLVRCAHAIDDLKPDHRSRRRDSLAHVAAETFSTGVDEADLPATVGERDRATCEW